MLIFLAILIIFFPILFGLMNNLTNKKIPIFNGLLFVPAVFQIILSPLTITKYINYFSYKIISFVILFAILFLFISYILFLVFIKKKKIDFKKLYEYLLISIILIISVLFTILSYYTSDNSNNDLNYYMNISKNFQYSIYSGGSSIYINDKLQNTLENHYLSPQMYYSYGAFFNNDLSSSYFLLNPLIYCLLILSIINSILNIVFKNIKIWQKSIILVCINFVSISSLYINVPAANLSLQSLVLLMLCVNLKRNNYYISLIDFIPFIGLSFFSSTGTLNSLIPCLLLFFVILYKRGLTKSIGYILIIVFILFSHIETFSDIILSKTALLSLHFIIVLFQISLFFVINYFYKDRDRKVNLSIPHNNLIFILSITIFLLTICLSLYNMLYLQTTISEKIYFENKYSYMYLSIMISLIVIFSINWYKNDYSYTLICILFFINFFSTIEYITGSLVLESASMWRLIYLLPGMGNIVDSVLIYFVLLICLFKSCKDYKITKKLLSYKFIQNKITLHVSWIISFSLVSIFSMVASYTTLFTYKPNMSFSKNVFNNLNIVSKEDIEVLKKINFYNWNKTYITDIMIYQYLNNATDITSFLNYSNNEPEKYIPSYNWNYSNFYNGIDYWNTKYADSLIEKTSDSIIGMINELKNNISSFDMLNIHKDKILKLDFLILYKYNQYSKDVIDYYKQFDYIEGKNIFIFKF